MTINRQGFGNLQGLEMSIVYAVGPLLSGCLGTLKIGHLIEVCHLIEIQYKLDRNGMYYCFIYSV